MDYGGTAVALRERKMEVKSEEGVTSVTLLKGSSLPNS
jgi:hypothetical protein